MHDHAFVFGVIWCCCLLPMLSRSLPLARARAVAVSIAASLGATFQNRGGRTAVKPLSYGILHRMTGRCDDSKMYMYGT